MGHQNRVESANYRSAECVLAETPQLDKMLYQEAAKVIKSADSQEKSVRSSVLGGSYEVRNSIC